MCRVPTQHATVLSDNEMAREIERYTGTELETHTHTHLHRETSWHVPADWSNPWTRGTTEGVMAPSTGQDWYVATGAVVLNWMQAIYEY